MKSEAKRRRTVLFQDGVGALSVAAFLFAGATVREVNLLMALGAFFAGFAAFDYWGGRRSLRRLRVSRILPDAIFAGEPFAVELEIDASERRASAWGLVVEDAWAPEKTALKRAVWADSLKLTAPKAQVGEDGGDAKKKKNGRKEEDGESGTNEAAATVAATLRPTAYFPRVRKGERRRERYGGLVATRGVRRLETLTLSTRFPCGFFRSSERFDASAEVLIFPKIGVLTERGNALAVGLSARDATVPTARASRIPDETLTVRDWRPGDSKKAIHWRATAKRNEPQVRDYEKRDFSVDVLILDLFFDETTRKEENGGKNNGRRKSAKQEEARKTEAVETAISFAATTLDRWARSNDAKFLLAINGETTESVGGVESGVGALRRALTRLATVEEPRCDRLAAIASTFDPRTLANARIFVVSVGPLAEKRLEGTWLERRGDARFLDVSAADFAELFHY
ncbi:MAG: DUF58 domain-containing protein [Thermoguttaceae bacterium]|nr:DUF58 domain-containing protein [Thermoguttaceae bacterium]